MLSAVIADLLAGDRGYQVIQQLPGIGPVLAAVIIAEIGDVTRFKNAGQLCSWAGLTPRHRESDTKVARGHVTKQGSRMLRWALIEAIQRAGADTVTGAVKDAIIARRGKEAKNIAKVAAARLPDPGVLRHARRADPLPVPDLRAPTTAPDPGPGRRHEQLSPGQRPGARSPVCLPRRPGGAGALLIDPA